MTIPQKKGSGNAGRSSEFFGVKRIMNKRRIITPDMAAGTASGPFPCFF
ncbi:hypothetical protein [Bilophila wadsworthia]|nr:hypothetical protein [Bilophila wadsworthia]